jgi:DNA-binding CsgD family transcriptional regulator
MQPCDRLTAKEVQVATLVWEGQTNREISKVIGTTEQVIKNYLRNTFDKLGVWSRLELALYVAAHGGLHWRDSFQTTPASPTKAATPSQAQAAKSISATVERDSIDDPKSLRVISKRKATPGLISA